VVTALRDGRVLVVGGSGAGDSAEVWDPATGTFSPAGSHGLGWGRQTATLLPDGRVLAVGGYPTAASVWDPATSTFSPTGSPAMDAMDSINTATLLPDGRVLVAGGGGGGPDSAEVWDPDTGTFGPAGSLLAVESYYEATALPDGRVLIVGGCFGECYGGPRATEDNNSVLASVELWDPVADTFGAAGSLSEARTGHSATLLPDGRVLVVGGWGGLGSTVHASAEVWAPSDR
jgi:WD40 repeat protein